MERGRWEGVRGGRWRKTRFLSFSTIKLSRFKKDSLFVILLFVKLFVSCEV